MTLLDVTGLSAGLAAGPLVSIGDVLRWRATHQAEQTAFTFLQDGLSPTQSVTYAELDRQARAIAAVLQTRFAPGERVMLCFPEGTEFIAALFGCFYAGMIAVPAPPPDSGRMKRSMARLHSIRANAAPALLLGAVPSDLLETMFEGAEWLYVREIDERRAVEWRPQPVSPDDLAYLQYTSGSTTTPKGVMIRHRNLMSNLRELQEIWPYGPAGAVASWMPNFHDYGLVEGVLRPLYGGVPAYLSSPRAFLKRPSTWLQTIARYGVTHSGAAAFAYTYCVQKISPAELVDVDLSCWQIATVGAEPVRPQALQSFAAAFESVGFRMQSFCPGYGLAELTLFATGRAPGAASDGPTILEAQAGRVLTGCGDSSDATTLLVVDPETCTPVPDTIAGEIWLAGPSVAAGYWKQPEETRAAFHAVLADTGAGPFFRTGDLGFLHEQELFVTGRLKNMLIVHGENYAAEELEWVVEQAHPRVQHHASAVFAVPGARTEQVVVVHEIERLPSGSPEVEPVMVALRRSVAEYFGIPVHTVVLVKRGTIPRTSSGKIQRHQCRAAYLDGSLAQIASWTVDAQVAAAPEPAADSVEAELARIWQAVLDVPVVAPTADFFDLGGDSLLALQLLVAVEEQFGQPVPNGFFDQPTVAHLAHLLRADSGAVWAVAPAPQPPSAAHVSPAAPGRVFAAERVRRIARDSLHRLRALVEQPILRLPYPLSRRVLNGWVGWPRGHALFYRPERRLIRNFLASLDRRVPDERRVLQAALAANVIAVRAKTLLAGRNLADIAEYAAAFGGAERFWAPYVQTARAAIQAEPVRPVVFTNLSVLEQLDRRRGVILLAYHSPYVRLAMLALLTLNRRPLFFLHRAFIAATARAQGLALEDDAANTLPQSALAAHVQLVRARLHEGGIVVIAGDSDLGHAQSVQLPVHGRWVPYKTGFAELALHTDAVVVPIVVAADANACIRITFSSPLDPGSPQMPRAERIRSLVQQYAAFFEAAVREAPETLSLHKMQRFLAHARVNGAAPPE